SLGFYNMSLNPENVTIDARIVDCNSLNFIPGNGEFLLPFYASDFLKSRASRVKVSQLDHFIDLVRDAIPKLGEKIFGKSFELQAPMLKAEFVRFCRELGVSQIEARPLLRALERSF